MRFDACELVKLDKVVELRHGYQLRDRVDPDPEGNVKYIQYSSLDREAAKADLATCDLITIEKSIDYGKYELTYDDVLFLSKGSKPGAFTVPGVQDWIKKGYHVIPMSHFFILKCDETRLAPTYLVWALNQKFMEPSIKSSMKGSGMPFIAKNTFMEFQIPIPSLRLQKIIAELSNLRIQETQLLRKKQKLLDDMLEALLLGKLSDESGDISAARDRLMQEYITHDEIKKELEKL